MSPVAWPASRLDAGHAEVAWPHILAGNFYPGDTAKAGWTELQPSSAVVNMKSQTEHNSIIILFNVTADNNTEECRECGGVVAGEDAASVAVMI